MRTQALQSNVTGFDAEAAESCPHKHEVAAAAELSALLVRCGVSRAHTRAGAERASAPQEGSKFVNPRKGGETPVAVASLAQLHGRVRECLQVSARIVAHVIRLHPNDRPVLPGCGHLPARGAERHSRGRCRHHGALRAGIDRAGQRRRGLADGAGSRHPRQRRARRGMQGW
jgi:hypothetical protein